MNLQEKTKIISGAFDYNDLEVQNIEKHYASLALIISLEDLRKTVGFLKSLNIRIIPNDINVLNNPYNEIESKINTFGIEAFRETPRLLNRSAVDIRRSIEERKNRKEEVPLKETTFKEIEGNLSGIINSEKTKENHATNNVRDLEEFRHQVEESFGFDFDTSAEEYRMGRAA